MTEQIGEEMTELDNGDSVSVIIEGKQYKGEITNTKRWKCELKDGFMESGSISLYLNLSSETIDRLNPLSEHILIHANEDVPHAWDEPQASFYDPTGDEKIARIGNVEGLSIVDNSVDSG